MESFELLERAIKKILNSEHRIIEIEKNPQIGVTTSILKVALENGKRVCVFEPTNRILMQTIKKVQNMIERQVNIEILQSNDKLCPHAYQDQFFSWYHCGDCKELNCPIDTCGYKRVLRTKPDILAMTYHKFGVLSYMGQAKEIPDMIFRDFDIIVLDEFTRVLMTAPPKILVEDLIYLISILKEGLSYKEGLALSDFFSLTETVLNSFGSQPIKVSIDVNINKYSRLFTFDLPEKQKELLRNFIVGLGAGEFIPTEDSIIANTINPVIRFEQALEESEFNGKILITGMSLPHTHLLNGKKIELIDYNETQKQRLIVCDKSNWDFKKHWDRERGKVKSILKDLLEIAPPDKIMCFAINKEIAQDIMSWDLDIPAETYPLTSWFRSEESSGISHSQKIIICIGLPWTPGDSYAGYDAIMKKVFNQDLGEDYLRDLEMSETAKNCIMGRGIDPLGKERSIVFILGGRKEELQAMMPRKKEIIEVEKQATLPKLAPFYAGYWLGKKVLVEDKDILLNFVQITYEDYEEMPKLVEILRYMISMNFPERIAVSKLVEKCFARVADQDRVGEILPQIFEYLPELYELESGKGGWSITKTKK
jgi:hypothetical protein